MKRICALVLVVAAVVAGFAGCHCPFKKQCDKSAATTQPAATAEGGCPKSAK
ncbi:MAG: hypothetical protein Q7T18_11800 [Sedimentisphaerales bacterium]|nr:hypothetical protein [Sedimentisphaerales bacterium]